MLCCRTKPGSSSEGSVTVDGCQPWSGFWLSAEWILPGFLFRLWSTVDHPAFHRLSMGILLRAESVRGCWLTRTSIN